MKYIVVFDMHDETYGVDELPQNDYYRYVCPSSPDFGLKIPQGDWYETMKEAIEEAQRLETIYHILEE